MIDHLQRFVLGWRRRRRARTIQYELAEAGYTADDLRRLARLREIVGPMLVEAPESRATDDPARPSLDDVLVDWRYACS